MNQRVSEDEGKGVTTISGIPLKTVYTPTDIADLRYDRELGDPGHEPYTRGPYPEMYRARPWRIFQLSGYGLPEDECERIKFPLEHGETGFTMEPDLMTLSGMYDLDSPEAYERHEELGMYGAPLLSLREYERALDGIPIEKLYAHPGAATPICSPYCHACYFSVAQNRGIPLNSLRGTGEGDFFLAYLATPMTRLIPPEHGLRLNCDLIEFCVENLPGWVPVSVPDTNARESGLNGVQQVAVTLANNIAYIEELLRRGRHGIDEFAHTLGGVGFCPHMDFFEDIAIMRAARRMWCRLLKERYGAKDPPAVDATDDPRQCSGQHIDPPAAAQQYRARHGRHDGGRARRSAIRRRRRVRRSGMHSVRAGAYHVGAHPANSPARKRRRQRRRSSRRILFCRTSD